MLLLMVILCSSVSWQGRRVYLMRSSKEGEFVSPITEEARGKKKEKKEEEGETTSIKRRKKNREQKRTIQHNRKKEKKREEGK